MKIQYVYHLIENIIKKINNKLINIIHNSKKYIISLEKKFPVKNYELRPCKKSNLKPKNDLPPYDSFSLLKNIANERLSFVTKNNVNIILIEVFDNCNNIKSEDIKEESESDEEEEIKQENKKLKISINRQSNDKYEKERYDSSCLVI